LVAVSSGRDVKRVSRIPRAGGAARLALLVVVGVAAAMVPTSAVAATTFNCDASAVRGTVLGQPLEPVTANRGQAACRTARAGGGGIGLPSLLGGAALVAATSFAGPADRVDQQKAGAQAGLTDLHVLTLPDLPIQLPTGSLPAIPKVNVGLATVDLTGAVQALLPDGKLPSADLLRLQAAYSAAGAQCVNGAARLTGTSQVAGVSVLGNALPVDQVVEQALTLVDSQSIDPSNANLANVTLPPGVTLNPFVRTTLQAALDLLPNIEIPATLAQVRVTPGSQVRTATGLTQQALRVEVSVAGTSLADLMVGEARVSSAGVDCAGATPAAAANKAALQCTKRRLVLTDVRRRGDHVRLVGAADRRYVGKTVSLVFTATGRVVARVKVLRDGGFRASVPLPSRALRGTNRARYQARLGRERSLRLKLMRRMTVTGLRSKSGRVTIAGRISSPLSHPVRTIVVKRRVSCARNAVVKRVRPDRQGRFRVTVAAPPKQLAAVYRLGTRVRKHRQNPKTFPTFTLPRAVALG
jgi:hypothetical protein